MNSKTQTTLLRRLRDGTDPLAWDEFFERYWPLIYRYARRRGCSEHTAEEIVQEVMLKVFRQRDVFQYDPQRGRFRDWLATVARNQAAQHRRQPSERAKAKGGEMDIAVQEAQAGSSQPDAAWEATFDQSLLMLLLDVVRKEMNPRVYLAFELFALEELPADEVARSTGVTPSAVYKTRTKVFKRLRELAGTYYQDGQLRDSIKQAMESLPDAAIERSLTARIEHSMRAR